MNKPALPTTWSSGFTLVEMMVVLGIFLMVFTLSNVSLSGLIAKHSTQEFAEVFVSEARRQQMRAISGELSPEGNTSYGIKYNSNSYVLFSGTFVDGSANNYVVDLPPDLQFTNVTFPNSQLAFEKLSGEVINFATESASVTILNTTTNQATQLDINQLGVITVQ